MPFVQAMIWILGNAQSLMHAMMFDCQALKRLACAQIQRAVADRCAVAPWGRGCAVSLSAIGQAGARNVPTQYQSAERLRLPACLAACLMTEGGGAQVQVDDLEDMLFKNQVRPDHHTVPGHMCWHLGLFMCWERLLVSTPHCRPSVCVMHSTCCCCISAWKPCKLSDCCRCAYTLAWPYQLTTCAHADQPCLQNTHKALTRQHNTVAK